jgi:hypothetical protein
MNLDLRNYVWLIWKDTGFNQLQDIILFVKSKGYIKIQSAGCQYTLPGLKNYETGGIQSFQSGCAGQWYALPGCGLWFEPGQPAQNHRCL